jgi:hypothetical protein
MPGEKLKSWREMLPFGETIYDAHPCGCCWHIVLDDHNVDDDSVEYVSRYVLENKNCRTPEACRALVPLMRRASKTQRSRLADAALWRRKWA